MAKCSDGQDAAIPCCILALWSLSILGLTPNLLLSVLSTAAFYYICLRPLLSFSQMEILPLHPLCNAVGIVPGKCKSVGLAASNIHSWDQSRLQVKQQGVRHSSVCLNLTRSRFCFGGCLSNCFLCKALVAPGTGGGFTESSLKCLNVTSAIGLLISLTAEGQIGKNRALPDTG